jgi:hypothetical protein
LYIRCSDAAATAAWAAGVLAAAAARVPEAAEAREATEAPEAGPVTAATAGPDVPAASTKPAVITKDVTKAAATARDDNIPRIPIPLHGLCREIG